MKDYHTLLDKLEASGNLRKLPEIIHQDKFIEKEGHRMLNLSSNDYLGLAGNRQLREAFLEELRESQFPLSATSSRLLTGNYAVYNDFEKILAGTFQREAALLFNSGYHANIGILPTLADKNTLLLADKLVHASLIDGILLSGAPFIRYRHNDYDHLETLLTRNTGKYEQIIIITESIFSMDGDMANLQQLVTFKKQYPDILLYVDEAHAIGVRGPNGLGIAEEQDCIADIDLLVGTFGKALASMGAYVVCSRLLYKYLVNTMRPLIFSTALPPAQIAWSKFLFTRLKELQTQREQLARISQTLRNCLTGKGGEISQSHIIPFILGENEAAVQEAVRLQRKGFYCLPVRPPTVPKGTSRIRFSLTAAITEEEIIQLSTFLQNNE
ncbi:MAG: 8-amino-7-oxononanoate synthase [Tannerellaceae bacterium]|nr:8-amino-7-oxononanoate synthase [Tannerellaceae bacterium]